jgi:putative beta-barrel porin BBP2
LRAPLGIGVITILLIGAADSYAQQSTATADPLEGMPIRVGPLGLSPTLTITNFGIDDNVFNDADNPQSDFTMIVTPRVQARLRNGRTLWSGSLATGLVYFKKFADERSIDYGADGRIDVDLDWFRPYALAMIQDTHDRLNVELDVRAPRTQTTLAAGGRATTSAKTALVFDLRHTGVQFAEGVAFEGVPLSQTLNSSVNTLMGGIEFYLTPLTTVTINASGEQQRFDESPDRDSDTFRIMPSIRLEAPAIIAGNLAVGFRRFTPLSANLPNYNGLVAQGSLSHTFFDRTKVDLVLSRDVQYSFELNEPYYLTTGYRVVVNQALRDDLDVRFTGGRDRLEYRAEELVPDSSPDVERTDFADLIDFGVGYRLRPTFRVGFDVERARRSSERVGRDYHRTRFFGSMTYGF